MKLIAVVLIYIVMFAVSNSLAANLPVCEDVITGWRWYEEDHTGFQCRTRTGAVLTLVSRTGLGLGWMDPSGAIWGIKHQGWLTNMPKSWPPNGPIITDSPAAEACIKVGAALPSIDEYRRFRSYFPANVSAAKYENDFLFPDGCDYCRYWTSSLYFVDGDFGAARIFEIFTGEYYPHRWEYLYNTQPVRCVIR